LSATGYDHATAAQLADLADDRADRAAGRGNHRVSPGLGWPMLSRPV
jgi:hypothetical protein